MALVVGVGAGFGAVGFRWLIFAVTWLATGHQQFGQQGRVASLHLPWLGVWFLLLIPVAGGLIYGPLIQRFAREARGHGVPEVMLAVAENGGRIRPQVTVVKALASAICIGVGRLGRTRGADRPDRLGAGLQHGPAGADVRVPAAHHRGVRRRRGDLGDVQRAHHRALLRVRDRAARVLARRHLRHHPLGGHRRPGEPGLLRLGPLLRRDPARPRGRRTRHLPADRRARRRRRPDRRSDSRRFCTGPRTWWTGSGGGVRSGPGPPSAGWRSARCCWRFPRCTGSATP